MSQKRNKEIILNRHLLVKLKQISTGHLEIWHWNDVCATPWGEGGIRFHEMLTSR